VALTHALLQAAPPCEQVSCGCGRLRGTLDAEFVELCLRVRW
jgi:hypothetical protein